MGGRTTICSEDKRDAISRTRIETFQKRHFQTCKSFELKINKARLNKRQKNEIEMLFLEAKRFYNHILSLWKNEEDILHLNSTKIQIVTCLDKDRIPYDYALEYLGSSQKQAILARLGANFKTCLTLLKKGKQTHFDFRFKSEYNCIPLKQYGVTHKFKSPGKMKIQGVSGKLTVRGYDQIPFDLNPDLANAFLMRKPDGYYVRITIFIDNDKVYPMIRDGEIGLDFGCKNSITTSNGEVVNCQIGESERIKKLSRKLNRRQTKRSNNRNRTIQKLRREYQKIGNRKTDFANKFVHKMKLFKLVVIQDEQLQNWHRSGHGRKVQHSCLGKIKSKLTNLDNVVVLDKFIPTTRFCCNCGRKHDGLKLSDRTFKCECGVEEDRDVHAARNMLKIFHIVEAYRKSKEDKILLPTEYGKVKPVEFKEAVSEKFRNKSQNNEAGRYQVFSLV